MWESPFIHSAVTSCSQVLKLVRWLISFTTLLCDNNIANWEIFPQFWPYWSWCPMKNQILIWNNDPSTSPNVTSCVENGSVVDMLDVTRNMDVSLDCACSAEKVYYTCIKFWTYEWKCVNFNNYTHVIISVLAVRPGIMVPMKRSCLSFPSRCGNVIQLSATCLFKLVNLLQTT